MAKYTTYYYYYFSSPYFAALGAYISDYIRWPVPDGLCLKLTSLFPPACVCTSLPRTGGDHHDAKGYQYCTTLVGCVGVLLMNRGALCEPKDAFPLIFAFTTL